MNRLFYISAVITIISTAMVVTRANPVHGLLYLIVSLFGAAMVFLSLGANFAAMLEVIVYAGAIMVLFIFVIMLINPGPEGIAQERKWMSPKVWLFPAILAGNLLIQLIVAVVAGGPSAAGGAEVSPKEVGLSLFGPYLLGVEIASILLLAGLVGAYHLGRRKSNQGDNP
jgi:NADH-quinone oxidoreductase subunit J